MRSFLSERSSIRFPSVTSNHCFHIFLCHVVFSQRLTTIRRSSDVEIGGEGERGGRGGHKMSAPSASGLRYRRKITHLYFYQNSADEDVIISNRNQAFSVLTVLLCSLNCLQRKARDGGR